MPRATPALRLSIFLREDDTWHHKPLYHEIVHRAKAAGLAGATVLRGIEGYGATSLIHTTRLLDLAEQLPVIVVIVDTEERVRAFLTELDDVVTEATVTVDEVEILRFGEDQR